MMGINLFTRNTSRHVRQGIIFLLLALCLLWHGAGLCFVAHAEAGEPPDAAAEPNPPPNPGDNVPAVEQAANGVVRIYDAQNGSTGSGFGVGLSGQPTDVFITNWHVITDESGNISDEIYILLNDGAITGDGERYYFSRDNALKCEVIYTTSGYPDLAILRAERPVEGRIALPLMRSQMAARGSTVYAIGYPGSADGLNGGAYIPASVSESVITGGLLSKFTRYAFADNTWVIQHGARVNQGNSGGPLVTENGAVIGINTYGYGQSPDELEYGLAIFIDYAMDAMDERGIAYDAYEENGALAWLLPILIGVGASVGILILAFGIRAALRNRPKPKKRPARNVKPTLEFDPDEEQTTSGSKGNWVEWMNPDVAVFDTLRLHGVSGTFATKRFVIPGAIRIGRDPAYNDLVFPADIKGISPIHCKLTRENGMIFLQDLNSRYGTFCKGKRLVPMQKVQLVAEDTFYVGPNEECFRIELPLPGKKYDSIPVSLH